MRPPLLLSDPQFQSYLKSLIEANGDNEKAGIPLEVIGDMVYTRRMRIHPEAGDITAARAEPKEKKEKTPTTKRAVGKVSDLGDLLS